MPLAIRHLPGATLPPIDRPPGGGDDGGMEHRITALETRLDTILPTLATKADMADLRTEVHKGFADNLKWTVGAMLGLAVLSLSIMTFVVNQVSQKAQASTQPAPIVITIPAASKP
jgi:hypothetical protein